MTKISLAIITSNRYNYIRSDFKVDINYLLKLKNISKYKLSKLSGVPYMTVNDICSGKAKIEKCSADTLYKLSKILGISMETLIEDTRGAEAILKHSKVMFVTIYMIRVM